MTFKKRRGDRHKRGRVRHRRHQPGEKCAAENNIHGAGKLVARAGVFNAFPAE